MCKGDARNNTLTYFSRVFTNILMKNKRGEILLKILLIYLFINRTTPFRGFPREDQNDDASVLLMQLKKKSRFRKL